MLSRDICCRVLRTALSTGGDYAEIFAENTVNHSIHMISDQVDAIKDTNIAGAAIRIYKGLRSVMASTVDTSEAGLLACAEKAAGALGEGTAPMDIVLRERIIANVHPVKIVPSSAANSEKVDVLKKGYFAAREYDSSIVQVSGTLASVDHRIFIANSEGLLTNDRSIRTRIAIEAVAEKEGQTQTGRSSPGRKMGLEMFEAVSSEAVGRAMVHEARRLLSCQFC